MAGRPSMLPEMMKPEMTEQILEKVAEGCYDIEIYKSLHTSAQTFAKWREANREAYDEAKSIARTNMLSLAESALQRKLTPHTAEETEIEYDGDGNIIKRKVKTKHYEPDSIVSMFVAKAGNMALYDPVNYRRLQLEEKTDDKIKDVIEALQQYPLSKYETPIEVQPPSEELLDDLS